MEAAGVIMSCILQALYFYSKAIINFIALNKFCKFQGPMWAQRIQIDPIQ